MKRVLLDENLPCKLRRDLPEYVVRTVQEEGWTSFKNGELLKRAQDTFDILLTADRRLPFQQNIERFDIGVIVVVTVNLRLRTITTAIDEIRAGLAIVRPGEIIKVQVSKALVCDLPECASAPAQRQSAEAKAASARSKQLHVALRDGGPTVAYRVMHRADAVRLQSARHAMSSITPTRPLAQTALRCRNRSPTPHLSRPAVSFVSVCELQRACTSFLLETLRPE